MSSVQNRRRVNLTPISRFMKKETNVKGMQEAFERYVSHLPQAADACYISNGSKTLAIIGSTGLLGPHIVASLLSVHKHSDIFCLNRSLDGKQRTESTLRTLTTDFSTHSAQLHFWVTDITQPSFGLTALQVAFLASRVDELIFNAWDPHWSKDLVCFETLLSGVRNTIDLCAAEYRRPRITFVSSICAVGDWPKVHHTDPAMPEAVIWDNHSAMPHGYGESKCIAEQILAKDQEVSGVPVSIVRAEQVGGASGPSLGAWPRQGWLYAIITASIRLKAFPMQVQPLDWIPVDTLAGGIANVIMHPRNASDVEVFNMLHPDAAPWSLLHKILRTRFGLQGKEESLPDWLDRLDPTRIETAWFLERNRKREGAQYDFQERKGSRGAASCTGHHRRFTREVAGGLDAQYRRLER